MSSEQDEVTAIRPATNTAHRKAEHLVGRLEEIPMHTIHSVRIDGRDVGIIRTPDKVYAIGNRCPHQGGPMCLGKMTGTMVPSDPDQYVYDHDGLVVQCPWHAYEFHVDTGESVAGALRGRVPVFEATIRDGNVFCSLNRPQTGGTQ
ncbi:Rieske 2Fe-2S domain-containing protein [Rhodococcus sp. USK10]|uniref:Rieske (2Fe-2S) protein n=1 Tax=Rhodococcus sp. USK10 TaxID=2789739 RepID=UPI001C5DFACD|nr:Rieske 2Fe-2S domain-containing protein [Rhodococcus sp. USK10]QYB07154.1 Rieske 2Fe-2S domain-containing protein [Rhodococcus sp. USK10]